MKESRCRGVAVSSWLGTHHAAQLRCATLVVCAACSERLCRPTAESNASNGPIHGPEALDRDILLIRELEALDRDTLRIPLREPHDEQHVGGGPPLLLPRCSAARAGSAIRLRAAPAPARRAAARGRGACPLDLPAPHACAARCARLCVRSSTLAPLYLLSPSICRSSPFAEWGRERCGGGCPSPRARILFLLLVESVDLPIFLPCCSGGRERWRGGCVASSVCSTRR
jgi:hypothetical protein